MYKAVIYIKVCCWDLSKVSVKHFLWQYFTRIMVVNWDMIPCGYFDGLVQDCSNSSALAVKKCAWIYIDMTFFWPLIDGLCVTLQALWEIKCGWTL